MKRIGLLLIGLSLVVFAAGFWNSAEAGENVSLMFDADSWVPVDAYTVPAYKHLTITDVMITNWQNSSTVKAAEIMRVTPTSVDVVTPPICIAAESTFTYTFVNGLIFNGGETVRLVNADLVGPITFFLRGRLDYGIIPKH